jgi:hypothetical protein
MNLLQLYCGKSGLVRMKGSLREEMYTASF